VEDENRIVGDVAAFFEMNERWPSAASTDCEERRLGKWLNRQRQAVAGRTMDPFRRGILDQRMPGWLVTPAEAWIERARDISNFLLANGRPPRLNAEPAPERMVAVWLNAQQVLLSAGSLHPSRIGWLDDHCPNWRSPVTIPTPGSSETEVGHV
jgi:hypothetical protein